MDLQDGDAKRQSEDEGAGGAAPEAGQGGKGDEAPVTAFREKADEGSDLTLVGDYAPVLNVSTAASYRAQGSEDTYMVALNAGQSETYKMTWATKLFTPKDVVAVVAEALGCRTVLNQGATYASPKFDCPGPRWGTDKARGSDPDAAKYERRHDDKVYNGGGMTIALKPMGMLSLIRVRANTMVKLKSGEEREVPLCVELEYNPAAAYGTGPPVFQGNLMGSFYVEDWHPNYRNAQLAKVMNELDASIGVQVHGKKVDTGCGYLIQVKAAGDEARVKAFRRKLQDGVSLAWRGEMKHFELGSHMDVEQSREERQKAASTYRLQHDVDTEGRQLTVRNLETGLSQDGRAEQLDAMAKEFAKDGVLAEFVCREAKSGKSAFAWITYSTEEEARAALKKDALREKMIDHGMMAWRNDPVVELKGKMSTKGDAAAREGGAVAKWYKPRAEALKPSGVEIVQVGNQSQDPMALAASMLKGSIQNGQLEGMFKDMVVSSMGQVVDPLLASVRAAVGQMEDGQAKVEQELRKQARKHSKEIAGIKEEQAETLQLVRKMAQAAGVPLGGSRVRASNKSARKRESSEEEEEEEDEELEEGQLESSEEEDEAMDEWPSLKSASKTVQKPGRRKDKTAKVTQKKRKGDKSATAAQGKGAQEQVEDQGFEVLQALCKNLHSQDSELVGKLLAQTGMSEEKRAIFEKQLLRK